MAALATPARRGSISVSGPGQKASTSAWANAGTALAKWAMPLASATADFSYEEPLQVADTTNPFAYGLVEAMLTMPMSSTQP